MQRVITTLGGEAELNLSYVPAKNSPAGTKVSVRLEFKNLSDTPSNEVVIRSVLDPKLRYVPGSGRVENRAVGSKDQDPFSQGETQEGWNIGTVAPGATVQMEYQAEVAPATVLTDQDFNATFSTREILSPIKANVNKPIELDSIASQIRGLKGVTFAEQLFISDLAPGSLRSTKQASGSVRVFGFDTSYAKRDPTVHILRGAQKKGAALVSAEAAARLSVGIGDSISIDLPDGTTISKKVSGIVDLTQARALFSSRHGANLEVFLYNPNSVILDTGDFKNDVMKPFQRAVTTRGERVKSLPIQEIDIGLEREQLNAEPAVALKESQQIGASISNIAAGQGFVLDHVSNTLAVASGDARVAKQMFVFLGLPGILLAAFLAAYAGIVLSGSQRREQAILRIRGASRKHLLSMLTVRVSYITASGALVGVAVGFATATVVVGLSTLLRATPASLLLSALIGTVSGLSATGLALYLTGRRSINQEINEDRAKFILRPPKWRRYWLDGIGLSVTAIATFFVITYGGFEGSPGSVYVGRSVTIALWLLALPIVLWLCGSLLGGRIVAWLLSRSQSIFKRSLNNPFSLLFSLSIRRRAWALAEAAIIIGLIVAFGTSLAIFTSSYKGAKAADARYALGSDIKIAPSPASKRVYHSGDAQSFVSSDVDLVAPVAYGIHNVILRSDRTSDVANAASVDPASYPRVAPLQDTHFSNGSATASLEKLHTNPNTILLSSGMASFLKVKEGRKIHVLLGKDTSRQIEVEFVVAGLFKNLPGFPDGADALMNIATPEALVPSVPVTFFLAHTRESSDTFVKHTARSLQNGVGADASLVVESRLTALAKDQSSLASLNIDGLLKIDSAYSLAMGATVITIFVFGLLLSRRREYVTLKAQGMSSQEIRALIGAEAATATIAGSIIGVPVGLAMAYYFINVLRPLFVLNPPYTVPFWSLAIIIGSVMIAAIITSVAASSLVNRLKATELLRDE
jgi:putative ABC transport system permease protein